MFFIFIIEIQSTNRMSLSVKGTGVCIVIVADRRPTSKATTFRSIQLAVYKNILIHHNILCENCFCTSEVTIIVVYLIRKPVELSGIADFITIFCILCCRLITVANRAESIAVIDMS